MEIRQRATVEVQVNGEDAKRELQALESYANSLKGRLAEAYKAGDTKKIKQLEKELRETNTQLKVMRTNTRNIDAAMNNIGLATPKELRNLIKDINAKLNSGHIKRGSAEWRKYQEQLKLVNAEIRKVNGEIKETQGWLTRFNNGFSKWGGLIASTAAAITGVSMALSVLRKNRDEKESSAANLKALTGLDDDSIQWLKRQAEILSTAMDKTKLRVTQSSKDILEAYMLVGSAKPDLLTNKEALNAVTIEAMRLASAAKMDLKDAVEAITVSLNQYSAGADQAGRFTNVLAAGSQKGSAGVVSQAAAIVKAGVSASGAKVQFEELVGTIEMLGEKGIKDEVAGTGLKKFFLVLQTGAKETNPAIVGLDKALENLQKKRMSAKAIKDIFGEEGYNVAKILIDNTAKVKEYTKAVTGTNVAMIQAAINSDTNEAKMAQYKNQIKEAGIQLMEKLNPSLSILTGWTTKLIKAAPALIDWTQQYGRTIVYAGTVLTAYIVTKKLHWFWLNKVKTETGQYILVQKLKQFWDKAVTASTWLYIAATSVLTGRVKQARLAMQAFFLVTKFHPLGLLLTVITAVAGGIYLLATRTKKAKTLTEEFFSAISEERNELNKIYNQLLKTNEKTAERTRLINEFNSGFGKYLTNLLDEKSTVDDIKKAYKEATAAMNDHYARELLASKQSEIVKESLDEQSKALRKSVDIAINATKEQKARLSELINDVTNQVITDNPDYGAGNVRQKIYEQINREFGSGAAYDLFGGSQGWEDFSKEISPFIKAADKTINKVAKLKDELAPFIKNLSTSPIENSNDGSNDDMPPSDDLTDKEKQKILKENLKKVEAAAAKEEALIKEKYAKGQTTYREYCKAINENDIKELDNKMALYDKESNEYNQLLTKKQDLLKKGLEQETNFTVDEIEARSKKEEIELVSSYEKRKINRFALNEGLFRLEVESLQKKQALYTKESKEWQDYEKQIIDVENREKLRKEKEYQQLLSSFRDQYSKKNINQLMKEEIDGIEYLHKEGLLKEEEYQELLKAIKRKYLKEKVDQVDNTAPGDESTTAFLGGDFQKLKEKYALINDAEKQGIITHQEALQQKAEADANYLEGLKTKMEVVYSSLSAIMTSYSNYANACQDLEIAKIEKKYDDEIKAAGDNTKKTKKLEEEKEKEIAKIKTKYNKKAMKIEIAQAFASMAMSAINAYSSAAQVPLIGYILAPIASAAAIAAGMMNIAAIKKQHQAQELGYFSGGFTPVGDPKKEVGTVHASEFVANHKAVNNPNILPVLQLIDYAQKNNTVGSLTAKDISMSLNKGYSTTPVTTSSTSSDENTTMLIGVMSNALDRASSIMEKLSMTLDEGIESYVTIDGEHGFEKQYNHYKKLKANKSRL
ncbi:phage tail tape measure protein [Bacteroides xylanisolvens]|uniref:phage tail tape measure protein n=1 Tax=Bacteroides xylanisolvens TaxID=371601 RepID=UPI001C37C8F5|nr:phage tail tape measure protein [Bacteroides xylanisolvens]MBV3619393.1 phage tail tape measure protein [Bacteroides xylanisolvens]